MAAPRLNFNRTTVVDPTRGAIQGLTGAQQTLANWQSNNLKEEQMAATLAQQDLANKRADAQLAISQGASQREQEKYDKGLKVEDAIASVSSSYNPYAYADNTTMDKTVLSNIDQLMPGTTPMIDDGKGGKMPAIDQTVYDKQAALQALYEKQMPTENVAYANELQRAVAAGVPYKQAAELAKTLTTDLTSDAEALTTAQSKADAQNARAIENWKMDNKLNIADSKGGKSSSKGSNSTAQQITKALTGISSSQWIGGDRDDAIAASNTAMRNLVKAGYSESDSAAIVSGLLQEASGKTDWTNDDVEFDATRFKTQLGTLGTDKAAASRYMNSGYASVSKPLARTAMPTAVTAGDYLSATKKASALNNAKELQGIFTNSGGNNFTAPKPVGNKKYTGKEDVAAKATNLQDVVVPPVVAPIDNVQSVKEARQAKKDLRSTISNIKYNDGDISKLNPTQLQILQQNFGSITDKDVLKSISANIDPIYSTDQQIAFKAHADAMLDKLSKSTTKDGILPVTLPEKSVDKRSGFDAMTDIDFNKMSDAELIVAARNKTLQKDTLKAIQQAIVGNKNRAANVAYTMANRAPVVQPLPVLPGVKTMSARERLQAEQAINNKAMLDNLKYNTPIGRSF